MSAHNTIVLTAPDPRGRFFECIVSGTPLPGTIMTPKAGVAAVGGRRTWEPYNRDASGNRGLMAILREPQLMGKGPDEAYADGDRGFLYTWNSGDELQVRLTAPGTGTGDAFTFGTYLIVEDATGLCIATTGTPEWEPFVLFEDLADAEAAGTRAHVMCV